MLNLTARQVSTPQPAPISKEMVVLVHGLAANSLMLRPLESFLRLRGYGTLNWGYSSIRGEINALGEQLAEVISDLNGSELACVHLVTHSMGSILARVALANHAFSQLGRVVMLGPPHRGSRVAAKLARGLGWFCKPLAQLSDDPESLVNNLPVPTGYEIGIVAAARDRVVPLASTWLSSQTDHVVVDTGHNSMLYYNQVAEYVATFLRQGRFTQLRSTPHASATNLTNFDFLRIG